MLIFLFFFFFLQLVHELKLKPSIEQVRSDVLQNHMSTPVSMVANNNVEYREITNRLACIDKNIVRWLELLLLSPIYVCTLAICSQFWFNRVPPLWLQGEYNTNSVPGRRQNDDTGKSVADRAVDRKRRRNQ
jgi:hypothetical protein